MWNGSALVAYPSFVEKKKLIAGDLETSMLIETLYPVFDETPADASISITVVAQNNYSIDTDLDNPDPRNVFEFLPDDERSQGYKVDPRVNGRLINFRLSSEGNWRLASIGIGAKPKDRR